MYESCSGFTDGSPPMTRKPVLMRERAPFGVVGPIPLHLSLPFSSESSPVSIEKNPMPFHTPHRSDLHGGPSEARGVRKKRNSLEREKI